MTARIAVIGGGICGLTAAFDLADRARAAGRAVEVVVHEASGRLGGKVVTLPFQGRLLDGGADAFLARVPWALELCRRLGIEADLVSPATGSAHVLLGERLHRLPSGLVLGVPTDLEALGASGIVSQVPIPRPAPAPLAPGQDVGAGAWIRAQLGDEVVDRLVDPLLGGINAGRADELSIRAAAPQLAAAAERDADLVAALRTAPPPAPGPVFYAPRQGMGALVDALVQASEELGVVHRTDAPVTTLDDLDADRIIIATPAWVAADLIAPHSPTAAGLLAGIDYASVALASVAYRRADIADALDGSGFLVPRGSGRLLTAASWATSKWSHLDHGDGLVILRVSAGRIDDARIDAMTDEQVATTLADELAPILGIRAGAAPVEVRVHRWSRGFPQYRPGHLDLLDQIDGALQADLPRVVVRGAALGGLGIPACIRQGVEAAGMALAAEGDTSR